MNIIVTERAIDYLHKQRLETKMIRIRAIDTFE